MLFLGLVLTHPLAAQTCPDFDLSLKHINAASTDTEKSARVQELIDCVLRQGAPLIEKSIHACLGRAIFFYRGPASTVVLAGDMNRWTQEAKFTRVAGRIFSIFQVTSNWTPGSITNLCWTPGSGSLIRLIRDGARVGSGP